MSKPVTQREMDLIAFMRLGAMLVNSVHHFLGGSAV